VRLTAHIPCNRAGFLPANGDTPTMVLQNGEKVHIIHRRQFEKDPHRHFIGVVDAYENGIARVTGNIFTVDMVKFSFFRRPEQRTRIIGLGSGEVLVNVLPPSVDLAKIIYKQEKKSVRVTDGSDWYLDISDLAWR
jgi:hypothetical protein